MELISWSINAVDTLFSARKTRDQCPADTFSAGLGQDAWGKWRPICYYGMAVEDIEDILIIGMLAVVLFLILAAFGLAYRASEAHTRSQNSERQAAQESASDTKAVLHYITRRLEWNAETLACLQREQIPKADFATMKLELTRRTNLTSEQQIPRQTRRHSLYLDRGEARRLADSLDD